MVPSAAKYLPYLSSVQPEITTEIPLHTPAHSQAVAYEGELTVVEEVVAGVLWLPPLSFEDPPTLQRYSSVQAETGRNLPNYSNLELEAVGAWEPLHRQGFEQPPTQPSCLMTSVGWVGLLVAG